MKDSYNNRASRPTSRKVLLVGLRASNATELKAALWRISVPNFRSWPMAVLDPKQKYTASFTLI